MSKFVSVRPNLEVAEIGPTVAFLRDVLGLAVEVEDELLGLALLRRDGVEIAVVRTDEPAVNTTTACYLQVTAVADLQARCVRAGAPIVVPLTDHPWGLRDFVVEAPGGHRIACGQAV